MNTVQTHASSLKSGRYVVFDGKACIVKSVQTSKTGKHGHSKARVEAIAIEDGQKIIKVIPGHDKVDCPIIEKKNAQVLSISGDIATVMDMESYETFEIKIPEDLKNDVVEGGQVMYWIMLGQKVLKEVRS